MATKLFRVVNNMTALCNLTNYYGNITETVWILNHLRAFTGKLLSSYYPKLSWRYQREGINNNLRTNIQLL